MQEVQSACGMCEGDDCGELARDLRWTKQRKENGGHYWDSHPQEYSAGCS